MPDYTLCLNSRCPIRDKCQRYNVYEKSNWQSYSSFRHENGKCDHYMPKKDDKIGISQKHAENLNENRDVMDSVPRRK